MLTKRLAAQLGAAILSFAILACPTYAGTTDTTTKTKVKTTSAKATDSKRRNSLAQAVNAAPKIEYSAKANDVGSGSPALISVLKDITKSLAESTDFTSMADSPQKAAIGIALSVLQTALNSPKLSANRIISADDKKTAENSMTAEAWDSGEVVINDNCHASASCLWARKANGLVNITIAGNCPEVNGQKLGEFVFVASGRSTIDSGFDIQSQASVSYWLGKLTNFVADTGNTGTTQVSATSNTTTAGNAQTATSATVPTTAATSTAATPVATPLAVPATVPPTAPAETPAASTLPAAAPAAVPVTVPPAIKKRPSQTESSIEGHRSFLILKAASVKPNQNKQAEAKAPAPVKVEKSKKVADTVIKQDPVTAASEDLPVAAVETTTVDNFDVTKVPTKADTTAAAPTETIAIAESTPATPTPSADAFVVTPGKAQAGQLITVCVVNHQLKPQKGVDVDFNGSIVTADADGHAQYSVPEDLNPGPTLKVSISGKSVPTTKIIQVVQPLATPSEPQAPHVDRVSANATKFDTVSILGHNFHGEADLNSVTIDGKWDAQVLATSPLELKILVPEDLPAGQHSVAVTSSGLKGNQTPFNLISLQVAPDTKNAPTRLIVRALGTIKPVGVHLKNNTPNIITIVKGNDIHVKTPGGKDNATSVSVRLKQRGNYNIQANIE